MLKPPPAYESRLVFRPEQDPGYVHFEHADAHPFQPAADAVSRVNAWWLAEAALLSYWEPIAALPTLRAAGFEAEFFSASGTDVYVAWQNDWVVAAFRGTEGDQWNDVLTDGRLAQTPWRVGHVHKGFAAGLDAIWPGLQQRLAALAQTRSVWFTGHSLGAALATLAADAYPHPCQVCTFGSPRVGDPAFATAFSTKFGDRHLRYVNNYDVVTHVPPPLFAPFLYRHAGPRRFIARDGTISEREPSVAHYFSELIGSPRVLLDMIDSLQAGTMTLTPAFLLDHMPKAYAIWTWNDYQTHG